MDQKDKLLQCLVHYGLLSIVNNQPVAEDNLLQYTQFIQQQQQEERVCILNTYIYNSISSSLLYKLMHIQT